MSNISINKIINIEFDYYTYIILNNIYTNNTKVNTPVMDIHDTNLTIFLSVKI